MKYKTVKKVKGMAAVIMVSAAILAGCGQEEEPQTTGDVSQSAIDAGRIQRKNPAQNRKPWQSVRQ